MKHLPGFETMRLTIFALMSLYVLAIAKIPLSFSQSRDTDPPIIAHQAAKIGYLGQPFNIIAYICDNTAIRQVTVTINYGGKSVKGALPERKNAGVVPVVVQAKSDLQVYSGPGPGYKVKGTVQEGEQLRVTGVKQNYYSILSSLDMSGYVLANETEILKRGSMYGVAIPGAITSEKEISYQITASDMYGNVAATDLVTVSFMTKEEIAELRSGSRTLQSASRESGEEQKGKSFIASPWFWTTAAILGGGAYYYYSQQKKEETTTTIDVSVGWK